MKILIVIFTLSMLSSTYLNSQAKIVYDQSMWELFYEDNFDYTDVSILQQKYQLKGSNCKKLTNYTWDQVKLENNYLVLGSERRKIPFPNSSGCDPSTSKPKIYDGGGIKKEFNVPGANHCPHQIVNQSRGIEYGMMEIRAKLPGETGTWPAFWTFTGPDELDYFEHHGENRFSFTTNFHNWCGDNQLPPSSGYTIAPTNTCQVAGHDHQYCQRKHTFETDITLDWHTFTMTWIPDPNDPSIDIFSIFMDGREIRTETRFKHHCTLPLTLDFDATNLAEYGYSEFLIDYIKVYTYTGNGSNYMKQSNFEYVTTSPQTHMGAKSLSISSENQVYYRNLQTGRLEHYYSNLDPLNEVWQYGPLPFNDPKWAVAGDIVTGASQAYYIGIDQRLQSYTWNSVSGWYHAYIDTDWDWYGGTDQTEGYPASFECGSLARGQGGVMIYRGTDNLLHSFSYINGEWVHAWVNDNEPDYTDVAGDIVVGENNTIYYRGANGRLQNYHLRNGVYQHAHIDVSWGSSDFKVSSECGSLARGQNGRLFYRGKTDNKMHVFYWTPENGWTHDWLPHFDDSHSVNGPITVGLNNEVFYTGQDGLLQMYHEREGNWYHSWVNENPNVTPNEILNSNNAVKTGIYTGENQIFFQTNQGGIATYKFKNSNGHFVDLDCGVNLPGTTLRNVAEEEENTVVSQQFEIFPNPVTNDDELVIKNNSKLTEDISIHIFNGSGKQIYQRDFKQIPEIVINANSLSNGLNIVKIQLGNELFFNKVIRLY